MANFTGRLALPCPNPDAGPFMNLATPPLALRTFALRAYYPAQLWNALHEIHTIVEEP